VRCHATAWQRVPSQTAHDLIAQDERAMIVRHADELA
jgi:hypothetical protein